MAHKRNMELIKRYVLILTLITLVLGLCPFAQAKAISREADSQPRRLLLDKISLGKDKKTPCKNLLPMGFKGAVTWKSDDETVLKIVGDKKSTLKPVKYGSAKLTATFFDGVSETVEVTVVERRFAATGVNVKGKIYMRVGDVKTPKAKVKPNTAIGRTLIWLTNDPSIATVDRTGAMTAVAPGKCEIYAVTTGAGRKVISVTVKKAK